MSQITQSTIKHVAQLANIPLQETEVIKLTSAFEETLKVVDELQQLSVKNIEPTHQVTQLENVMREDKVEPEKMLTQDQALSNAKNIHQGFFVVPRILEK